MRHVNLKQHKAAGFHEEFSGLITKGQVNCGSRSPLQRKRLFPILAARRALRLAGARKRQAAICSRGMKRRRSRGRAQNGKVIVVAGPDVFIKQVRLTLPMVLCENRRAEHTQMERGRFIIGTSDAVEAEYSRRDRLTDAPYTLIMVDENGEVYSVEGFKTAESARRSLGNTPADQVEYVGPMSARELPLRRKHDVDNATRFGERFTIEAAAR
jgi:hypothetical protein